MSDEPARIVSKTSLRPMLLSAFGCLLASIGCFFLSGIWFMPPADHVAFWGFLGIPVFSSLMLLALASLAEREVVLRVRPEGLYYARYSDRLIAWEDIEAVKECGVAQHRVLCIELKDRRAYPAGFEAERAVDAARLYNFGDFAMSMRGLAGRHDRVVEAVEAHLQRRKRATKFVPKPAEPAPTPQVRAGFGNRKRLRGLAAAV
ncbi:STM3941 family protein [Sphingomicrobium sediminis]|uniref:PH domain-containing protein n=1 Tax=Sphingomicrobium sediminis TaxID=2950949 RepID=A0A9X2EH43_9SPHN|nr:STM3941 family protein [Sphingomicrobium sediminis]MCM8556561.1 hypothetical protein [Sphingomicrobium sediminis]